MKMNTLPAIFGKMSELSIDKIIFLEGESNYTNVYGQLLKPVLVANTLKHFEGILLAKGFLRIHRSYLINPEHIRDNNFKKNIITLSNGTELKVARRRMKNLTNKLYQPKPV